MATQVAHPVSNNPSRTDGPPTAARFKASKKNLANAVAPASVSGLAAVGILAITGSTEGVGLGVEMVVVVVGAADVVVFAGGVFVLGPGSPPVHAPSVATATSAAAYGRSVRCRCGVAAAVIGVPCRSSTIVRLHRLTCVHAPRPSTATYDDRLAPASRAWSAIHRISQHAGLSRPAAAMDLTRCRQGPSYAANRGDVDDRWVRGTLRPLSRTSHPNVWRPSALTTTLCSTDREAAGTHIEFWS